MQGRATEIWNRPYPKNLIHLVRFQLQEAERQREEYAIKGNREMWQLWRGKAKAFKKVIALMERKG